MADTIDTNDRAVDIPETPPPPPAEDPSLFDPGSDLPPAERGLGLGEDPAYDPGGMGFQPDVLEDQEDYG